MTDRLPATPYSHHVLTQVAAGEDGYVWVWMALGATARERAREELRLRALEAEHRRSCGMCGGEGLVWRLLGGRGPAVQRLCSCRYWRAP